MASFTRCLLLAIVGLATNLVFTAAQSSTAATGCQTGPTWLISNNTNVGGGQQVSSANTPALCQAACLANLNCIGADFNSFDSSCWLTISGSAGQRFNGTATGITRYDLISRGSPSACPGSSSASPAVLSTSIASCTNTWTLSLNTNYAGGTGISTATTLTACQAACAATTTCVAIDFNPAGSTQCYWLSSLSGTKFSGSNSGISHYDINRCATTTTTQAPTPCIAWAMSPNTNYAGGIGYSQATTLAACQAACIATATCIAIDFNPNGSPQCYWLTSLSGTKFSGSNSGISHYDLTRSCPSTSTTYSIISHKYGGFLTIDPMTFELRLVDDFNKATWFSTTTPCLAASISGFNNTVNCVSWSPVDMPGYYVRNLWGNLVVQQQSGQYFSARFAEDASFYMSVDTFSPGFIYVQPVIYPSNTYYYIRGCDDRIRSVPFNSSGMYTDSASFFSMSFEVPSSAPDTDSCMLTWTRTSGARGPLTINKGHQSLEYCRQLCIMFPNCSGVSYNYEWGVCFLETLASLSSPLVAGPTFVYFDLVVLYSGQCSSGCRSTWLLKTQYLTNYIIYTINADTHDCRHSCVNDGMCIGINWSTSNGVNNCTKYYTMPTINWYNVMPSRSSYGCCNQNMSDGYMPSGNGNGLPPGMMPGGSDRGSGSSTTPSSSGTTSSGMSNWQIWNGTVSFFAVTKSFSQCGSCAPQIQIIPGVTDVNGVRQVGVNDRASCRTACINNRQCTAFEMINSTLCYFSLTFKPLLTASIFSIHFDVTRSPCGNGCQDKWDFYPETTASGMTPRNVATETDCRLGCQADATCVSVDWNYRTNSCYWGTSSSVRNVEGTSPEWNHYDWFKQPFCDED